jgi:hypothetical protein
MPVILAPSANLALAALLENVVVLTVEAEYGSFVAEGTKYTAAHHQASGKYQGRHTGGSAPAPCNDPNIPVVGVGETILLSHIDLDSVGGAIRGLGVEDLFSVDSQGFWDAAEFVDTNGAHRLAKDHQERPKLGAWWAWLTENRPKPNHKSVSDITDFVAQCEGVLRTLLHGGEDLENLLKKGKAFLDNEETLNRESLISTVSTVSTSLVIALRVSDKFVNHLYALDEGAADAVLALNTTTGSITLSFEDGGKRFNAREIVQSIWTERDMDGNFLAGGHPGIAGSPRGEFLTHKDLGVALGALVGRLLS